ncbi:hypothetical protein JB92DRAFT_2816967 [Gautieria morchelliformis]|nr:hypothetical protein JB92DRAFT_2816967 [Gautieria morchelliformis]
MLTPSSRALSPPRSTVSSVLASSPVQIKKVVVEGRSKHDGASLRMYIKLSVAVDNTQPGASIPLFPERNIRIAHSKVHPLDERSVPYHFSSSEQPLLQKTAVALQLGPKSSRSYHTLFPHLSPPLEPAVSTASRRGHSSTSVPPHSDERYTGYILVSGYNVTLVLPKEFPPNSQGPSVGAESDGDDGFAKEVQSPWLSRGTRRPSSLFHNNYLHMMAGMDLFIPYALTPPKGPFLVSIPVPRCLDNHLKLRISTPSVGSSPTNIPRGSFTSTSSEDDAPGWDFLIYPPVTRKSTRKTPYRQSADDEHSDTPSVASTPGTELIQGAYQSTDVLHVRWAPPLGKRSSTPKTEDGMPMVNVERTVGKMKSEVVGRDRHSVTLNLTYNGVCTGLWHPGVATVLCLDVALDVKGRRVSWIDDKGGGWTVSGKDAFSGLYSDASPPGYLSRKVSFDSGSSAFLSTLANRSTVTPSRGTASLLRAPLPNETTPDYSFENSPNATPPAVGPSSSNPAPAADQETSISSPDISPGKPVTIKVNLLKLLPPGKNELHFSLRGLVLIDTEDEDFVTLPTFHVLGSDREKVDNVVSSHTTDSIVQVGSQVASTPRRTLRVGEEVRCEDGVGLVLRPWESPAGPSSSPSTSRTPVKPEILSRSHPTDLPHVETVPNAVTPKPARSPSSQLPCVSTTVTPLVNSGQHTHCVRMSIPVYSLDADTIEFGLALPQQSSAVPQTSVVDMLYASYAGKQVSVELRPLGATPDPSGSDVPVESQVTGEIQFIVVVHLEDVEADTGTVEVVYLVGEEDGAPQGIAAKNKGKAKADIDVDVLLPCFELPVAQYQVEIDCPSSFTPYVKHSTLPHHHVTQTKAPKLVHFRMPAGFIPTLSLSLVGSEYDSSRGRWTPRRVTSAVYSTVAHLTILILLYLVVSMGTEVRLVRETMQAAAQALANGVPYSDIYWGAGGDPFSDNRWWTPDQFVPTVTTVTSTATSVISEQKETTSTPVTPTINLAEATPMPQRRPRATEARAGHAGALIPLPAVQYLSMKLPLSTHTKELIAKGLMKVWYVVRKAWNFPVDPD